MCRHMTFHHIILTTQVTGGKIVKGAVTPIISLVEHLLQARSGLNAFAYVIPMKPSSIQRKELLYRTLILQKAQLRIRDITEPAQGYMPNSKWQHWNGIGAACLQNPMRISGKKWSSLSFIKASFFAKQQLRSVDLIKEKT